MRHLIDIDTWPRKQHYELFKSYKDPFYGIVVNIDCTVAFANAKDSKHSFFLSYLHNLFKQ